MRGGLGSCELLWALIIVPAVERRGAAAVYSQGVQDTVGEFNDASRHLPRGDESPRYFTMSLQDIFQQFQSCRDGT